MSLQILMPALSPTMTVATLVRWVKQEGDTVHVGDVVAEAEADMLLSEITALEDGVISKILVTAGTPSVRLGTPLALLGELKKTETGRDNQSFSEVLTGVAKTDAAASRATVSVSPLARRVAEQAGLDLSCLKGTGPGGRIVLSDVEIFIANNKAGRAKRMMPVGEAMAPPPPPLPPRPYVATPSTLAAPSSKGTLPRETKIVSVRSDAKAFSPLSVMAVECAVDPLLALLASFSKIQGTEVSLQDALVRAVALALKKVPKANALWLDETVIPCNQIDLSLMMLSAKGSVAPAIRRADTKNIAVIAEERKLLAKRAEEDAIKAEDCQDAGFTLSYLGDAAIDDYISLGRAPQACCLSVGAVHQKPVVSDGAVVVAGVIRCSLTVDHRAVDLADGAAFLDAFRSLIEEPLALVL